MSLTELGIRGMTCASCAAHVTRALQRVPGVEEAAVNLATERATVLHTPDTEVGALVAAVERAGYGATTELDADREARERAQDVRARGRFLLLAVVFCVPAVALAMLGPSFPAKGWVLAALAFPVWAIAGWPFHRSALSALRSGSTTMDTLVSLGSTAAYGLGLYDASIGRDTTFDTAAAIVTLISVGKYIEARARAGSSNAMRTLLQLRPQTAQRLLENGAREDVPVELVHVGDRLAVAPGERIPVDGVVLEGRSAVDRSMLTGESMPDDVSEGSTVEQGTLNADGALVIRATAVGAGTELARIVEIVRRAQGSAPPVQRLADRVSAIFVPSILGIAVLTLAGWMLSHHSFGTALVAAVAVLVIACPCALGLATPTAIVAGIGAASRRGILFKDSSALERAAQLNLVFFDKTGTLTTGEPSVERYTSGEALSLAASVERASTHPLARAIVAAAQERGITIASVHDVTVVRGAGVAGTVDGAAVIVGRAAFLRERSVACDEPEDERSSIFVARNGTMVGRIDVADRLRPHAREAVDRLRALGIESVLLSGDAAASVRAAADGAGIARRHARMSPEGKADAVQQARAEGRIAAFVGDGINDAPALARADVGIAMGGGTAVALEVAGAALLSNDPRGVAETIDLARATMRTIAQNLFWAFAYNVVLIPLAAAGIVSPVFAAAAMGLSSLFVVGNSLRLARR